MLIKVVLALLVLHQQVFFTLGWSSKLQHPSPLVIKTVGNNIISCESNCYSSQCKPQIKALYQSTESMLRTADNFGFFIEPGIALSLCYKSETFNNKLEYFWRLAVFRSFNEGGVVKIKSLTPKTLSSQPVLRPQINVTSDISKGEVLIECSIQYPVKQNQILILMRVLSDGRKIPLTVDPLLITGMLVNNSTTVLLKYNYSFLYNQEYIKNTVECTAIDQYKQATKSATSDPFTFEREMAENVMIDWNYLGKSKVVAPSKAILYAYDDFVKDIYLTCREEIGVPKPQITWEDSTGRWTDSENIKVTFAGSNRYCCHASQILTNGNMTRKSCVDINFKKFRDCHEIKKHNPEARNGVYIIYINRKSPLKVYCDMETANQEWIVIQRRLNGLEGFDRFWIEYKGGFGDVDKEFWIGNDILHKLTSAGKMKVRFDLWNHQNLYAYAEYNKFSVADEGHKYKLLIDEYMGNASDSLIKYSKLNGMYFSTRDRDNDENSGSCSSSRGSAGWWFRSCTHVNLNGIYYEPSYGSWDGIYWYYWNNNVKSLRQTEIKVKYIDTCET